MRWRHLGQICLAAAALIAGTGAAQAQATAGGADTGKLKVTVDYKGTSGAVDKDHKIWIWVFDSPTITAESTPLAVGTLTENKTAFKFMSLPKTVYLAAAYDDKGGFDGSNAPPPTGTPVIVHGAAGPGTAAVAVPTGGDDAAVTVTFDDTVRMP